MYSLIKMIPIENLHPHPDNPRKDLGDLTELAASIEAKGVLQNLTVVPYWSPVHKRVMAGLYTIIIGHRRHAAAQLAGVSELPCVVADMSPQEQFETMMVENVQRSDLTVYEQAEGFQMMLNMGGSVQEVAQKTGFSETTVRNRVKLLSLDKKKFQKAEQRGATITDYLKLNEIKDPDLRNKVLDTIGTADFNNKLKNAIAEEAFQERMERVRNYFRNEQDWCRERTDETCGYNGDYAYHTAFDKYHDSDPVRPDDADTVDYIWSITGPNTVTIYKKVEKKVDPATELKKQVQEKLEGILENLKQISETHLEMREEFILDFTAIATHEMDIAAFATKAIIHYGHSIQYGRCLDLDRLANLMKISVVGEGSGRELNPSALNTMLFNRPQYALLCTAYSLLEYDGRQYCRREYDSAVGFKPTHSPSAELDLIYEGLTSMGYEMSEEEIQMKEGTHPLFNRVENLIAEFKEELAKYEKEKA